MKEKVINYVKALLENTPKDWIELTTHRLDIYNEELAKTEFLTEFEKCFEAQNAQSDVLNQLPTAYDYIRLGHPLSSVLEWTIALLNGLKAEQVISFSSQSMPILAVLRKNAFDKKNTVIYFAEELPSFFRKDILNEVYGYTFELKQVKNAQEIERTDETSIFVDQSGEMSELPINENIDFYVTIHDSLGSILMVNGEQNNDYISAIQHVRRRETIAMTPANSFIALQKIVGEETNQITLKAAETARLSVVKSIKEITHSASEAIIGSSGLSIQYAIMMGLIHDALDHHKGKAIKIIVPPNCYGGTNDQARRVAACLDNVEIMDLPVDGDHDMVQSTDLVLDRVAEMDAVPYIIAEIPTNPRVEVPDLELLEKALTKPRKTPLGKDAIPPVFILDQTFCPNFNFLGEDQILSSVQTISYVSGSKFPSGGKCTAGYCVSNQKAKSFMTRIEQNIRLCDNQATALQLHLLAEQLPSMLQRIQDAYVNTREFVQYIEQTLPEAKINFVSEEIAQQGFTPSVFSLDLPTKGGTHEEREAYKRSLNQKLIEMMITEIPTESKYCVSYGQLKGCYWTIPATSTQGTTKEDDKDYIARVSVSPDLDLAKHKEVFKLFCDEAYGK
jgi:cystathionine beta-lyase/cystathionine gamma-synthase